jgi:hypothetical protein
MNPFGTESAETTEYRIAPFFSASMMNKTEDDGKHELFQ